MKTSITKHGLVLLALSSWLAFACGSENSDGGSEGSLGSGASCTTTTDCAGNEVCLGSGDTASCTFVCSGSIDECGAQGQCGQAAVVKVNVCRKKEPAVSEENPPESEEEFVLRCSSDAECAALESGAICAQQGLDRFCTFPCSADAQCNPPAVQGVSTNFFECAPDDSSEPRTVCLLREECFANPSACYSIDVQIPEEPDDPFDSDAGPGFDDDAGPGFDAGFGDF